MGRLCTCLASLLLLLLGGAGAANAQAVPTKTITFYNNSTDHTLYPVIQAPIMSGADVRDLWLQAQFNVGDVTTQIFNTTLLYKIYVNRDGGIPPGHSVTLTLPFYTQLLPVSGGNLGTVKDQYIDWWNAMRVFVFDGRDAVNAAYNYSVDRTGKIIPPIPVNPVAGAALPSCASDNTTCEPLVIKAYVNGFPPSVPAQLIEYTFAAAQGPPLDPKLSINRAIVNFNISAVDQVYLPAAIGARGNHSAANAYLGSTEAVAPFRSALEAFSNGGKAWPFYVPAYYTAKDPTIPLPAPPAGGNAYPEPQIPSTNTVYAELFRNPPPAPPVLSSDTTSGIGKLGQLAQGTLDLWNKCTSTTPTQSATCTQIREVNTFFVNDYQKCFPGKQLPATPEFLTTVYGWVQFPGCAAPLVNTAGYSSAIATYCDLQYNFFEPAVLPEDVFNPYVSLVHQKLASNAYAFSIDDAVSFKSLPGDGIVITIAGSKGLDNTTQTPLPTASTYHSYCRSGGTGLQAPPPLPSPTEVVGRGIRVRLAGHPRWGIGEVEAVSGTNVTVTFPNHGTVVVDTRHHRLRVVDSGS